MAILNRVDTNTRREKEREKKKRKGEGKGNEKQLLLEKNISVHPMDEYTFGRCSTSFLPFSHTLFALQSSLPCLCVTALEGSCFNSLSLSLSILILCLISQGAKWMRQKKEQEVKKFQEIGKEARNKVRRRMEREGERSGRRIVLQFTGCVFSFKSEES